MSSLTEKEKSKFKKQLALTSVGIEGQTKLKNSKVLVIGAGGLGCPVLQYIAASGIGTIGIVDEDTISLSNLPRQVLFTENEIGIKKTKIAKSKCMELNPEATVNIYEIYLDYNSALEIIPHYDIVVDCTDNFQTRYHINDACTELKKPFVTSAIYKNQAQLSLFNVLLRNNEWSSCLRDIYEHVPEDEFNCNDFGVIGYTTGIMGSLQVNLTINYLLGNYEPFINKLFLLDLSDLSIQSIEIFPQPKNITPLPQNIKPEIKEINNDVLNNLIQVPSSLVIDVRDKDELPQVEYLPHINIPLSLLEEQAELYKNNDVLIFICKSGIRSYKAAQQIKIAFPDKTVYSLKGGINELISI